MKLSIITPWHGDTLALLPDYARAVAGADEVIVIDNATPPPLATALRDSGYLYLRNDTNAGFAAANNQGYAVASGDIILFLNSDISARPGWLDAVRREVADNMLCGPSVQAQLLYGMAVPYVEGWCVAARRATWARIGAPLWDTAYPLYWEDNDLSLRAVQAGVDLARTTWAAQHKGGQSAGALVQHGAAFEAGRTRFASHVKVLWERRTAAQRLVGVQW